MKTILYVSNSAGALARFRHPLIRAAVNRGWNVHAICGGGTNWRGFVNELEGLGAKVTRLPGLEQDGLSIGQLRREAREIGAVIDQVKPDIVHSFTHRANVASFLALRSRPGITFIPNVTGAGRLFEESPSLSTRVKKQALLAFYRAMGSRADIAFFQNPTDREQIGGVMGMDESKLLMTHGSGLHPDSVNVPSDEVVESFSKYLLQEHGISADKRLFLFPARALHSKGLREYFAAAEQYLDRYDDAAFLHAGDGVNNPAIGMTDAALEKLKRPGIASLGFREDILTVMECANVVVLPSFYREGTPRALIEGLFLGKIIVTTDMPGCRETVKDGWNGYMIAPRSTDALFDAFVKLRDADVVAMQSSSRELFDGKYHADHVVGRYMSVYDQVEA